MIYIILAGLVFVIFTVVGLLRSEPMPLDMEREEVRLEAEEEKPFRLPKVYLVVEVTTPDRPVQPWRLANQSIEDLCREALGDKEAA